MILLAVPVACLAIFLCGLFAILDYDDGVGADCTDFGI